MGIKVLILEACIVASAVEGSKVAEVGETVDVPKDDAVLLCRLGRAYFLDKSDDPTKGSLTAGTEERDKVKRMAKAIADDRKAREDAAVSQSPANMAAMVAAAVAQAVQSALAPAART